MIFQCPIKLPCIIFPSWEKLRNSSFLSLDLEDGRIPSEDQQVVNQLEEKLNAINKFATEAYNSVISNAQVIRFVALLLLYSCPLYLDIMFGLPKYSLYFISTDR